MPLKNKKPKQNCFGSSSGDTNANLYNLSLVIVSVVKKGDLLHEQLPVFYITFPRLIYMKNP